MRKIVFLIGAVAVLIGLFLLVGEEATEDVTEVNQKSSIADENQNKSIAPAHWESFSKTQTDFSFSYPPQAEISNEAGRIKVQVIGPQNKIDTEITDGFTLFLDTKEKNDQTLEKLAQNHFDEITQRLRPINQPTRMTIHGKTAYSFEVENELGDTTTHIIREKDLNTAFLTNYSVDDPQNKGYEKMIHRILGTLKLR